MYSRCRCRRCGQLTVAIDVAIGIVVAAISSLFAYSIVRIRETMLKLIGVLCWRPSLQRVSMGVVCVLGGRNATSRGFCVVESVRKRGSPEGSMRVVPRSNTPTIGGSDY